MLFAFQWFWFAYARKRVFYNIFQQRCNAIHNTFIALPLPILQIFISFGKNDYFHKSSISTILPLPFFMSS